MCQRASMPISSLIGGDIAWHAIVRLLTISSVPPRHAPTVNRKMSNVPSPDVAIAAAMSTNPYALLNKVS